MKDYPRIWADALLSANPMPMLKPVTVVGERDTHLGPRLEFARVRVLVEPAAHFEVIDATQTGKEIRNVGFPDSVVLGILDVLMVALGSPVKAVRVVLEEVEYDPINSSPMAFRQAGRDAGRKVIKAMSEAAGGRP